MDTLRGIGIKPRDFVPASAEAQRQRQSHVAAANDSTLSWAPLKNSVYGQWHEFRRTPLYFLGPGLAGAKRFTVFGDAALRAAAEPPAGHRPT